MGLYGHSALWYFGLLAGVIFLFISQGYWLEGALFGSEANWQRVFAQKLRPILKANLAARKRTPSLIASKCMHMGTGRSAHSGGLDCSLE